MVRVNVNRIGHIADTAGLFLTGFVAFVLTGLSVLSFYYWIELAQAILLIAFPLCVVGALSVNTAAKIHHAQPSGEDLYSMMSRHRMLTQSVGMVAIFFTAMFGMYENLNVVRHL